MKKRLYLAGSLLNLAGVLWGMRMFLSGEFIRHPGLILGPSMASYFGCWLIEQSGYYPDNTIHVDFDHWPGRQNPHRWNPPEAGGSVPMRHGATITILGAALATLEALGPAAAIQAIARIETKLFRRLHSYAELWGKDG